MATPAPLNVEALILKATNPLNTEENPNIIQSICHAIGNEAGGIQTAVRLLVHKMQSPQEKEAMQALLVLQACVNNCGTLFQNEIGKFRFLNEMVKLVSPKYLGNQTSCTVKKRVLELLYTWTLDLCEEPKVLEAYTMLKKQTIVIDDPQYLGAPSKVSAKVPNQSFEDHEKSRTLQRLLQSTRPEDVSKANDMIKNLVKDDERRLERSSRRIVEIETAMNNVKVLDEMLTQHEGAHSVCEADLELMGELYTSCSNLRTNIHGIVSEMDDKDDGLGELIKTCDDLFRVMGRYKVAMGIKSQVTNLSIPSNSVKETVSESKPVEEDTLLDLLLDESNSARSLTNSETNKEQISCSKLLENMNDSFPESKPQTSESVLDELGDIFAKEEVKSSTANLVSSIPIIPMKNIMDLQPSPMRGTDPILPTKEEPLSNIDFLGSSLLELSLSQDIPHLGSQFKPQEKISLNQMKQKLMQNPMPETTQLKKNMARNFNSNSLISKADIINKAPECLDDNSVISNISKKSDTSILDHSCPSPSIDRQLDHSLDGESLKECPITKSQLCEVKPMNDLNVTLQDIKAGTQSPITVIETTGISMTLHFTQNKPRPDVSIVVITVTSKNPQSVTNYTLQAVVPKGCKVRLLAPSSTTLYEYSPFLPPPAITQIMMIANPNKVNVSLKAMLSYSINDDVCTEMGEVSNLSL